MQSFMKQCSLVSMAFIALSVIAETGEATDHPKGCVNLTGTYRNQLNSTMTLVQNGRDLTGTYASAVESQAGSSGGPNRPVQGHMGAVYSPTGVLATWTVMWKNGSAATTWNGQCYEDCATAKTIIRTTWTARDLKTTCSDEWGASRIGQDIFERVSRD